MTLIPIKATFGRREDGSADYPDFNRVSQSARQNKKGSHFIDQYCIGWHYNKIENLGTGHAFGTVCTLAPADFAEESAKLFPPDGPDAARHVVTIITEEEFETFWDDCSKCHMETENLSGEMLAAIQARIALEQTGDAPPPSDEIKALRKRRLDPDDDLPGITKNTERRWKDAKIQRKLTVASKADIEALKIRVQGVG